MKEITRTQRKQTSGLVRPLAFALSVAAFSGTLLMPKSLKGEEPRPAVITLAQGGPAAVETPQPKEDVNVFEDEFVRSPKRGVIGKLLIIYDKTNGAVRVFEGDREVGQRFGDQIVVRPTKTGLIEVRNGDDIRTEIWVRSEGTEVRGEERSEALDAACRMIDQGIKTGMTREASLRETLSEITAGKSMLKVRESGREDRLNSILKMYEDGASADQILIQMREWGYTDFVSIAGKMNALIRMASNEYSCDL